MCLKLEQSKCIFFFFCEQNGAGMGFSINYFQIYPVIAIPPMAPTAVHPSTFSVV